MPKSTPAAETLPVPAPTFPDAIPAPVLAFTAARRARPALKMKCPFCPASASGVWRSRGAVRTDEVLRTRFCAECGGRFPTTEAVDHVALAHQRAGADKQRLFLASEPRAVDMTLWQLAPTPDNIEAVLQRLWGDASVGRYRKEEFAAFRDLLQRGGVLV